MKHIKPTIKEHCPNCPNCGRGGCTVKHIQEGTKTVPYNHCENKGLTVFTDPITDKMYCNDCGMPIVNEAWWKEIHLKFHNYD